MLFLLWRFSLHFGLWSFVMLFLFRRFRVHFGFWCFVMLYLIWRFSVNLSFCFDMNDSFFLHLRKFSLNFGLCLWFFDMYDSFVMLFLL